MLDFSSLIWDDQEKVSVFRPRYIQATVIPDEYSASGTPTPVIVDISSANSDGNIIITLPAALTYDIGDRVYLLSGLYQGIHKIYRTSSLAIECLTKFSVADSSIGLHHVENNNITLTWTKLDSSPIDSIQIEPVIKQSDNTINVDICGYLQSAFIDFEVPDTNAVYDLFTGILFTIVSGPYAFNGLGLYAAVPHSVFNPLVDPPAEYNTPLVDNHVIFLNYKSILPFIKDDGIYNLFGNGDEVKTFIDSNSTSPKNFNYSELCNPNSLNIFFINKYGGWQNFVAMGNITFSKEITEVKEFITSYPTKRRISDSGFIYKVLEVMADSIPFNLLSVITAMIESPVTFIYNDSDNTITECLINKKSFQYYNTNDKTISIKFDVILSEVEYTQNR